MEKVQLTSEKFRLGYHVMAPSGWINDPNGFCYFKGYYHIFYQYYPYSENVGSPMHWGHARSKDLIHWETLPIALTPGDPEDKDGCFSGSAIVKDNTLYLIYTGHHLNDSDDSEDFWENQNIAYSTDGVHFTKYAQNPVIATPPSDNTQHFRDPKVWQYKDVYYMILGSQSKDGLGRVILYKSKDLEQWAYLGEVDKSQDLTKEGFMWECPDLFKLNDQHVLLLSPQGIEPDNQRFLNLFQTGYFVGQFDYAQHHFNRQSCFRELDNGHDFYAAQTTTTPDGRTVLIGWMNMWENNMLEQEDGWSGALTLPRTLEIKNNHLYMNPIDTVKNLRLDSGNTLTLENDNTILSTEYRLFEAEVLLDIKAEDNIRLSLLTQTGTNLITLDFSGNKALFTLYRKDYDDYRYAQVAPTKELKLRIFVDKSSLEIFINDGEKCFTERYYYPDKPQLVLENTDNQPLSGSAKVYKLKGDAIQF